MLNICLALTLASTVAGCVSISTFAPLVAIPVGSRNKHLCNYYRN